MRNKTIDIQIKYFKVIVNAQIFQRGVTVIPLFYFPCTIVAVDDNNKSLETLQKIIPNTYSFITFNHPTQAKNFLQSYQQPLANYPFYRQMEDESHDLDEHIQVDFNLSTLTKLQQLPQKNHRSLYQKRFANHYARHSKIHRHIISTVFCRTNQAAFEAP